MSLGEGDETENTGGKELGVAGGDSASTEGLREGRGLVSGRGGLTEFLKRKGQVWAAKGCLQACRRLLILGTKSGVREKGPEEASHAESSGPGLRRTLKTLVRSGISEGDLRSHPHPSTQCGWGARL